MCLYFVEGKRFVKGTAVGCLKIVFLGPILVILEIGCDC